MIRRTTRSHGALCWVLVTIYGMLALLSQGPHRHEVQARVPAYPASSQTGWRGVSWAAGAADETGLGDPSGMTRCRLCAFSTWSRATSRSFLSASARPQDPAHPLCRPISSPPRSVHPLARNVLLRAPPSA